MSLRKLGLTPDQESLYRYLLRTPRADLATAQTELGVGLQGAVDELRALGLVDDLLIPLAPAAAVDMLVRRRMELASRELARLDEAFDVVRDLAEEARRGRTVELVERLPDATEVNRRVSAMLDRSETMNAKRLPRSMPFSEQAARRYRRLLADGMASRTLVRTEVLELPEELAYARQMHGLGDLHRVSTEPYLPLLIIDRRVAFVLVDPGRPYAAALMVGQPGIVAVLVDLFERLWARAVDLDGPELSATEAQVLRALAEHSKDETAARALNMSLRKYRTHVADLMTRLGASTRFQAALRARERGWL